MKKKKSNKNLPYPQHFHVILEMQKENKTQYSSHFFGHARLALIFFRTFLLHFFSLVHTL